MNRPRSRAAAAVLLLSLTLALPGCRTAATAAPGEPAVSHFVAERLYFGRNIPGGGTVSEDDWNLFLREVVTPRFPDGLTVYRAAGQWRDAGGAVVREESFVVEVLHREGAEYESSLAAIAAEYKQRFRQESVLRVTSPSDVRFY